jgi:hypothetical protein
MNFDHENLDPDATAPKMSKYMAALDDVSKKR